MIFLLAQIRRMLCAIPPNSSLRNAPRSVDRGKNRSWNVMTHPEGTNCTRNCAGIKRFLSSGRQPTWLEADMTGTRAGCIEVRGGRVWYREIVSKGNGVPPRRCSMAGREHPTTTPDLRRSWRMKEPSLSTISSAAATRTNRTSPSSWAVDRFVEELARVREVPKWSV